MTHAQSALQIWSVLVLAARNQQVVSYGTMESITGVKAYLQAPILERIEGYCKDNGYPKLTAILINQKDGIPGSFYPGYKGTSEHPEDPAFHTIDHTVYVEVFKEQSRVFVFDWLKKNAPTEEDFQNQTA